MEKRKQKQQEGSSPKKSKQQAGILDDLPVTWSHDDGQGEFNIDATIQRGWSQEYATRDAVIQGALEGADPGGQVSLGDEVEYDEERALRLLTRRGWLDVEDFIRDEQGNYPADDDGDSSGMGEIGWNVKFRFKENASARDAWTAVEAFLEEEYEYNDSDEETLGKVKTKAEALLNRASSIRFARYQHSYRHTDYPCGSKNLALQFVVVGEQVELVMTESFQVL